MTSLLRCTTVGTLPLQHKTYSSFGQGPFNTYRNVFRFLSPRSCRIISGTLSRKQTAITAVNVSTGVRNVRVAAICMSALPPASALVPAATPAASMIKSTDACTAEADLRPG
eukprot:3025961-Rhodomonas_salina.2